MSLEERALPGRVIVMDVGKSMAKLSLWDENGQLLELRSRTNDRVEHSGFRVLDAQGIEQWAAKVLREFAALGPVVALVPVGHGAGAALVRDGVLAHPVLDYEDVIPEKIRDAYQQRRGSFSETGSPALPDGLNLGIQIFRLQQQRPELFADAETKIVPWSQYWAWRFCGVAASEVSSLGCHTDLWCPRSSAPSLLAHEIGFARHLAPLRSAGDVLGTLTSEWVERTGLSANVAIYCGLHDSNAALLGARGFPEIGEGELTVLSTGTWFVAMRSTSLEELQRLTLSETRDCLVNVDVHGRPVPSARFMGGREIELLGVPIDGEATQAAQIAALPELLRARSMVLPSQVADVGPYPKRRGGWISRPESAAHAAAGAAVYAALMADVLIDLVGGRDRLLVEGRFAASAVFMRTLATLRKGVTVYASGGYDGVRYGALRLVQPALPPPAALQRVTPLDLDFSDYRKSWRELAEQVEFKS